MTTAKTKTNASGTGKPSTTLFPTKKIIIRPTMSSEADSEEEAGEDEYEDYDEEGEPLKPETRKVESACAKISREKSDFIFLPPVILPPAGTWKPPRWGR